jgi:hypothetical protein
LRTSIIGRTIIVIALFCGVSASPASIKGDTFGAPIERPKQEDDWKMVLGAPALLTVGLFIMGRRKLKKNHIAGRKEKRTKRKRGRWKNIPY